MVKNGTNMILYSLTFYYKCRIIWFYLIYMSCATASYVATLLAVSNFSYEVLRAVLLTIQVLWDMTQCYCVSGSKCSNVSIAFFAGHFGGC